MVWSNRIIKRFDVFETISTLSPQRLSQVNQWHIIQIIYIYIYIYICICRKYIGNINIYVKIYVGNIGNIYICIYIHVGKF